MIKVAINGFGRIGRLVFRIIEEDSDFAITAINDLSTPEELAHLLKYDTSHGKYRVDEISHGEDFIKVGDREIKVYAEKDPKDLPWGELEIDAVYECTGFFTDKEKAEAHIEAGAKKVIISAPATGDLETVVYNVNEEVLDGSETVISAASCTTNCLAPVINELNNEYGVEFGYMTTIHAYTNAQTLLDRSHKKGIMSRRGRAGAANIIPTSTGAAKAIGKVLPELEGKLKGTAMRVPTTTGSLIDLTLKLCKKTSKEEINELFKLKANETLGYTEDPIVSSDIIGISFGALVDGNLTDVLDDEGQQMVKVVAWYDNEMSYSYQMVRTVKYLFRKEL